MTKLFQIITCLALAIFFISPAIAADAIGHVQHVTGSVIKNVEKEAQMLKTGDEIFLNDKIEAGEGALAQIKFIDDTEITVGEHAVLTVDKYVFDPAATEGNGARFGLMSGAFHYISGKIAKQAEPDVKLDLDFGSIGIRGTELWRDMVTEPDGTMMCRIFLGTGAIHVYNENGDTTLKPGEGTKIKGEDAAPTAAEIWAPEKIAEIKAKTALNE